ncbi:unnamed protein product [Albugo candida]|nr:unnamed protein product [Albugo candida]|eukprot:CCI42551.1 unnamed protein product [Albugo candida]
MVSKISSLDQFLTRNTSNSDQDDVSLPEFSDEELPSRYRTASEMFFSTLSGMRHHSTTNLNDRESVSSDGKTSLEVFIQQDNFMSSLVKASSNTADDRVDTKSEPRFIELDEEESVETKLKTNTWSDVQIVDESDDNQRPIVHETHTIVNDDSKLSTLSDDLNIQEMKALLDDHGMTLATSSNDSLWKSFDGDAKQHTNDEEVRSVESIPSPHSSYSMPSVFNKNIDKTSAKGSYTSVEKKRNNNFTEDHNGRHEERIREHIFASDQSNQSLQKNDGMHTRSPSDNIRLKTNVEESWEEVNAFLRGKGLEKIELTAISTSDEPVLIPNKVSLINLIHEITLQLEKKDQKIQQLCLDFHHASRSQRLIQEGVQTRERMIESTNSNLETSRIQVRRLKDQLKQAKQIAEGDAKKWKQSCQHLRQQLKTSERRVKTKELQNQQMQEKLQEQVDKQQQRKLRDRELFRKLKARYPKRGASKDNEVLDCISVLSEEREDMRKELEDLKIQLRHCNAEIRDKENRLSRMSQTNGRIKTRNRTCDYFRVWTSDDESCDNQSDGTFGWRDDTKSQAQNFCCAETRLHTSDELLQRLEADRRYQEGVIGELRQRESSMAEKINKLQEKVKEAKETVDELMQENSTLTVEAGSRPTIQEYRSCERRLHQLERKLSETKMALNEAKNVHQFRKLMDTKDLVARDRLGHRLGLKKLNSLPRETLLDIVKDVCRLMNVADVTMISTDLEKLCKVVAAVPRMEAFIRDVCGFVYDSSRPFARKQDDEEKIETMEVVIPTLERWTRDLKRLTDLEYFYSAVMDKLSCGPSSRQQSRDAQATSTKNILTTAEALQIISDLMQQESDAFCRDETYKIARTEIEQKPTVLIHQIIRHFSHLFQVKSLEGVMPKMNEIYLFVSELQNFLVVARNELCLPKSKTVTACLNEIRDRWRSREQEETSLDLGDSKNDDSTTYVVEKPMNENDVHLVGVQQVREMSILIHQLKRELGASSAQDILPRTRRLMELLSLSLQAPHHDS